jgi:organic hydroperoxide reductase OsmC/OhrA
MSLHRVEIRWERQTEGFSYPDYNREHRWFFEGGAVIPASAAPVYLGAPEFVDPEEAFVAAVSSCHMLTFLAICARKGIVVNRYTDRAVGYLEKNRAGRRAITHVELSPEIEFEATRPDDAEVEKMHHLSHEQCFIANSIKTHVTVLAPDAGR